MTRISAQKANETDIAYVERCAHARDIIAKRHTIIACRTMCRHMIQDLEKELGSEAAMPVLELLAKASDLLNKMPEGSYEVCT